MVKSPPTPEQSEVCSGCPVQSECLEELISIDPKEIVGTWAGLTNVEWKVLRKENQLRATDEEHETSKDNS
jgi:hypothetical protein